MSSILKWMIVLLLLLTVAGGGGAYWCYVRSDEMLRIEVLKQLQALAPDLKFAVERANFDFSGRIRLHGLAIQLPDDVEPALYVPETVATLDERITEFEFSILRLRFVHPQLHVVRQRDGRFNWQGINWVRNPSQAVPEIEVEHGTVVVELQRERRASRKLKLADLNIKSVPSAARKITAVVSTRIEPAGPLSATIDADLDGPPFQLEAKWLRLPVDDELLDLIGEFSPAVGDKVLEARQSMAKLAATQAAATTVPLRPAGSGSPHVPNASSISLRSEIPPVSQSAPGPFGLKCNCDLHCRLNWSEPNAPPNYQVLAELRSGQFSNVLLPFPLYEIRGSVYVDPREVIIRDLRAENGATRLYLSSHVAPNAVNKIPQLKLQLRNCQIDEPLKARLPEQVRKLVNSFALTGLCDLDIKTVDAGAAAGQGGDSKTTWEGDLRLTDGTLAHEKFAYPIHGVNGTARWRGNKIDVHAQGTASGVPVAVNGWVLNPGSAHEAEFIVTGGSIPINATLLDACPTMILKALVDLDLQGRSDLWLRFQKSPGIGQKYRPYAVIRPVDCSCSFKNFAYRIEHLQGRVIWNEDVITFKGLQGRHDETELTAEGHFLRVPAPGRLDLTIRAKNAAFDRSLEAAIPVSLHRLWQEFQPSGQFDVDTVISWIPGQPCQVTLPTISVKNGEITMQSFSWPMQSIAGEFSYEASRLVMKSVSAQHDDTQIRARGMVFFPPGEPWRVQFEELHVDDLIPNSTFRRALPTQLRNVFDVLNPAGKFSVSTTIWEGANSRAGAVQLMGGTGLEAIASAWDLQLTLAGSALSAGVRVDDIHGRIDLKGASNGKTTDFVGKLDLDSISVFREASGLAHQIARVVGPISLENGIFTGGSRTMAMPNAGQAPRANLPDRISGDAIDGKLTLDVYADLKKEPDFSLLVTLTRGRLESYAHQYLRGQSNLAGIMNGWMHLWGKGKDEGQVKGRGELQIAPAALYELPVFVQIFQALRLDAGDRTAFDRADIRYNIENSRFNFDAIHLKGTTIDLVGRGYVRFDGAMQFDFYSMLARNQMRIPIVSDLAGLITRGWVGVKVTGNVGSPQTRMVPVPEIDDVLRQLLGTFEQPLPGQRSANPRGQAPIR